MKHFILGLIFAITGLFMTMTAMTYASYIDREAELDNVLAEACENAVSQTMQQNRSYDISAEEGQNELIAAFLQNLSMGLDSNADFKVEILAADAERGLLKVKVTETFKVPRGNKSSYTSDCTVILDQELNYRTKRRVAYYIPLKDDPATLEDELTECNEVRDGALQLKSGINKIEYPQCLYKEITISLKDDYVLPKDPVFEGYEFTGWYDKNGTLFARPGGTIDSGYLYKTLEQNSPLEFYAGFVKV